MTDEQSPEVVIHGEDGTEHVFPPGFDPVKAAGIVRAQNYKPDSPLAHGLNAQESDNQPPGLLSRVTEALKPLAHPQSLGDFTSLLVMDGGGGGLLNKIADHLPTVGGAIGGTAGFAYGAGTAPDNASVGDRIWRGVKYGAGGAAGGEGLGMLLTKAAARNPLTAGGRDLAAAEAAVPAMNRATDLSTPVQAGSLTQDQIGARIAAVKQAGGLTPDAQAATRAASGGPSSLLGGPLAAQREATGTLPTLPSNRPAVTIGAESPLQAPRVATGAEAVGRAQGLTKEAVRAQTAPILGEAQGAASPILPQGALTKIIDTMKAMPVADREAYVARATSGKSQWQIENIRRTLEHLGLLVPVAAGAGMLRTQQPQ